MVNIGYKFVPRLRLEKYARIKDGKQNVLKKLTYLVCYLCFFSIITLLIPN